MSLFDALAGQLMGKVMGESNSGMGQIAMEMFDQYGGLNGILDKFKQADLGHLAASWIGTGENLPISAEQISSALGSGAIAEMAAKVGITPEMLSSQLAKHLPSIVDKMTPNGEVGADSGSLLSTVLGMLK